MIAVEASWGLGFVILLVKTTRATESSSITTAAALLLANFVNLEGMFVSQESFPQENTFIQSNAGFCATNKVFGLFKYTKILVWSNQFRI